jgi:hypothetical protein
MYPTLEDWHITKRDGFRFPCLRGKVFNHPTSHLNGKVIDTSPILQITPNKDIARTESRLYKLGRYDAVTQLKTLVEFPDLEEEILTLPYVKIDD